MNRFWKGEDEKKIGCIKCNPYKFKKPKISFIIDKTLVLPIICDKCGSNYEKTYWDIKNYWLN